MKRNRILFLGLINVSVTLAQQFPPSHFDWRDQLGGLTPIKSQLQCGSPYAFAATAALETAILINEGARVSLSDQQLVSCDKSNLGCSGGFTSLPYLVQNGVALESDFPYQGKDLVCPSGLKPFRRAADWGTVGNGKDAPSPDAIKAAILDYGAVISEVEVTESFTQYDGGVYKECDGHGSTNHLMNLVGWDDERGYWIARNSWGVKWGEQGFMRIKYGCNGIGSAVTYVVYKKPGR